MFRIVYWHFIFCWFRNCLHFQSASIVFEVTVALLMFSVSSIYDLYVDGLFLYHVFLFFLLIFMAIDDVLVASGFIPI